jgi:1-deoxy-D-xylulose-5-phosphate reductoisomerase
MQSVTILGATGSIGLSTLDVMSRHTNDFCLYAVTGNTNVEGMLNICEQHKPRFAVMANDAAAKELTDKTKHLDLTVLSGPDALVEVASAPNVKIVMAAIVGGAGLLPTIAAAHAGKRICLANKEALVMSGQIFLDAVRKGGAELLPVDSEHNAIFQSLPVAVHQGASLEQAGVNKILLTGSGGPFLSKPLTEFEDITPAMAVAHPNWSMGANDEQRT